MFVSGIRYQIAGVRCQTQASGIRYRASVSDIKYQVAGVRYQAQASGIRYQASVSDIRYQQPGIKHHAHQAFGECFVNALRMRCECSVRAM